MLALNTAQISNRVASWSTYNQIIRLKGQKQKLRVSCKAPATIASRERIVSSTVVTWVKIHQPRARARRADLARPCASLKIWSIQMHCWARKQAKLKRRRCRLNSWWAAQLKILTTRRRSFKHQIAATSSLQSRNRTPTKTFTTRRRARTPRETTAPHIRPNSHHRSYAIARAACPWIQTECISKPIASLAALTPSYLASRSS